MPCNALRILTQSNLSLPQQIAKSLYFTLSISNKMSTNEHLIFMMIFSPLLSKTSIYMKVLGMSNIIKSLLYFAFTTLAINTDSLVMVGLDASFLGTQSHLVLLFTYVLPLTILSLFSARNIRFSIALSVLSQLRFCSLTGPNIILLRSWFISSQAPSLSLYPNFLKPFFSEQVCMKLCFVSSFTLQKHAILAINSALS